MKRPAADADEAAVEDCIPTMLDSFMCTVVPLVTLTNKVPQLRNSSSEQLYVSVALNEGFLSIYYCKHFISIFFHECMERLGVRCVVLFYFIIYGFIYILL